MTSLMTTEDLKPLLAAAAAVGCLVKWDREAGTIDVLDDDKSVLKAIQKGRDQPWIVRFIESDRIKWSQP